MRWRLEDLPEESGAPALWGCVALLVWLVIAAVILLAVWLI